MASAPFDRPNQKFAPEPTSTSRRYVSAHSRQLVAIMTRHERSNGSAFHPRQLFQGIRGSVGYGHLEPGDQTRLTHSFALFAMEADYRLSSRVTAHEPVTIPSLIGLAILWRRSATYAAGLGLSSLALFLFFSSYRLWNQSHYGNRFLMPIIALAAIPLASLLEWGALRAGHVVSSAAKKLSRALRGA
jgi:hypothetical protein